MTDMASVHPLNENDSLSHLNADFATRTVRGLVLPWNELAQGTSATGEAPLEFPPGSVTLPSDFSALNANLFHEKYYPVARFTALESTHRGIEAEFTISATPEGDQLLADVTSGRIRSLSAEMRDLVRDGSKAVSAVLTGAAFCLKGAFKSAALFSLAPEDEDLSPEELIEKATALIDAAKAQLTKTPEADEAEENTTPESPETDEDTLSETPEKETTMDDFAVMPEGVGSAPEAKKADTSASSLFKSLARLNTTGTPLNADFALEDITNAGIGGDLEQPQWAGQLWQAREYKQKSLPLFGHADLTSYTVTGYRWVTPPTVGLYAGNKTAIPSNTVDTETYSVTAQRIAGGHDIDRKFRDFGNENFWADYFAHMTRSYAKVADDYVFSIIEDAADANVVTVDDEAANANVFDWLIDAALQVEANDFTPTFALIAPDTYKAIVKSKEGQDTLAYISSSFGLDGEGTLGGFQVRVDSRVAAAGHKAIVGSREAATVYELPGSPIRVEGLDVARAGIDPALYGYLAVTVNKASGLVVIDGDA